MPNWTWKELETLWEHPDWTASELAEVLPHSAQAIRKQRQRAGRYHKTSVPLCCMCEERPVWYESKQARKYALCKSCYLDEERRRLEDEAKAIALRQRRRSVKKKSEQ